MNTRSRNAIGFLALMCGVTGIPSFITACHKEEPTAASASASAAASAPASASASVSAEATASATDSSAADEVPSTTASVPTPQDYEQTVQKTVTTDSLDTQLNAIEKQIENDPRK